MADWEGDSWRTEEIIICDVPYLRHCVYDRPPLWPSGQSSWLQTQRCLVRLPALPDFLRNNGSGMVSTQSREYNWRAAWKESSGSSLQNREYSSRDPLCWPCNTLYQQRLALTSPTRGGRSAGIVRSWPRGQGDFFFVYVMRWWKLWWQTIITLIHVASIQTSP
jgi:hypothetical protein